MFAFYFFSALVVLAGRVLAASPPQFNVTLDQVYLQQQILAIPPGDFSNLCLPNVTVAQGAINACSTNDTSCLCTADVVQKLRSAQQCMFDQLIAENIRAPDPRVGSNVLMSGYSSSCTYFAKSNFAASQVALTVPSNWDGPFDAVMSVGGTAITVIAGGMLGFAALMLLSNIE